MKRAYSIAAVALALSLLVGYVVYAQRQSQKPAVAPGSKSGGIMNLPQVDGAKATWAMESKSTPESNPPPSSTPAP